MAGLLQVARLIPSPANAILLEIDKGKGLGLLINLNAVFKLCIVGAVLVGHNSKPLRKFLVKYGKICEPTAG